MSFILATRSYSPTNVTYDFGMDFIYGPHVHNEDGWKP